MPVFYFFDDTTLLGTSSFNRAIETFFIVQDGRSNFTFFFDT